MYTHDELNAFLEEGAKKLGVTTDELEHAIWRQREESYFRNDIQSYLKQNGITYTDEDVMVILNRLDTKMEDIDERVMDAISDAREYGELSFGENGNPLEEYAAESRSSLDTLIANAGDPTNELTSASKVKDNISL